MNAGEHPRLVRGIRTFADDVKKAQARSGSDESPQPAAAQPAPAAQARSAPAPAAQRTPAPEPPAQTEQPATIQPLPMPPADPSHLSDEGKFFDIRSEAGQTKQEGTIVKDTRAQKWSLSRALGASIKDWVSDKQEAIAERIEARDPEPTVAPSDTRAHIIKAAREQSALAPKDDHRAVVEKLRTFARDAERVTGKKYAVQPLEKKGAEPHWSYTTDAADGSAPDASGADAAGTTAPDARRRAHAPSIKRARESLKPRATAATLSRDQAQPERATHPAPPVRRMERDVAPTVPQAPEAAPPVHDAAAAAARREAAVQKLLAVAHHDEGPETAPAAASRDIPFEKPETSETDRLRTYRNDAIADVERSGKSVPAIAAATEARRGAARRTPPAPISPLPFAIAGLVMGIMVLGGGIGAYLYWGGGAGGGEVPPITRTAPPIVPDAQTDVAFATNRAQLLANLDAAVGAAGGGIVEFQIVHPESGAPVGTGDVMFVLDPRAPGSFVRTLGEQLMAGAVERAPFMILRAAQYEAAYAGMLDWEPYMSADLTPLYGTPVRATLDPTARTNDQTRAAFFTDVIVANTDTRVLYDEDGDERIVYAFLDRETIVITTSTEALAALIERYR